MGNRYFDQLERTGHAHRADDFQRFAALGIRTLRFPLLWERTAPEGLHAADWRWSDAALGQLRDLGIRPIVGLLHHGSGPLDTSLVDPAFPIRLADYARAVAERYPWIDAYTPINEPLTTARFSALYGHWYPHARDVPTFTRALLAQCRGVVQAMQAIRAIVPSAHLIQTDDIGRVFSTPTLAYQADFENERRWLAWDLLCGRVDRAHPLWSHLVETGGAAPADLEWFAENACPPSVIGLNHYLSSDRFLDDNLSPYPSDVHGGNARHLYADVSAVRMVDHGSAEPCGLLAEAWQRFGLPVAITETHNACTREEQLRWLLHVWDDAHAAQANGVDVRAVTAWSLLGAFDWDALVTVERGHYDPGAFDIRAPAPRPTALATMIAHLAAGRRPGHPVLASAGWWRRPERFIYGGIYRPAARAVDHTGSSAGTPLPLLISGATGTLGRTFARLCAQRGLAYVLLSRADLDIADRDSVANALAAARPWAVINTAGYVRVDDAEHEPETCFRENATGPATLADACARLGIPLVTFSSDLVFDGRSTRPYIESDVPDPLNVYGVSKARAEASVLARHSNALVIRTSAFFGPWDEFNFVTIALRELEQGHPFVAANDCVVSPTYVPDLVHTTLDLLIDGECGIWHLANHGAVTWAELARLAAAARGCDATLIRGVPTAALHLPASRPAHTPLGTARGLLMPTLEDALARYIVDRSTVQL
ncbi:MAG: sugar nucleotide-binding protein [Chloroflexi bacterium]|nr:sugar nucleotide-binding protein [Chloroflexota bacterium]